MTYQSIHLVHLPKTGGSSLHLDISKKLLEQDGCFFDHFDLTRSNCEQFMPGLEKEHGNWTIQEVKSAQSFSYMVNKRVTNELFGQLVDPNNEWFLKHHLIHYHIAGNSSLISNFFGNQNSEKRSHLLVFTLRDPILRTLSHLEHLRKYSPIIHEKKLWPAIFINSNFGHDFLNYDFCQNIETVAGWFSESRYSICKFASNLNFLKLYQIRYLISFFVCQSFEDRQKVLFKLGPEQIENIFLNLKSQLKNDKRIVYTYLSSKNNIVIHERLAETLHSAGCKNYNLDVHHKLTQTKKTITASEFIDNISQDLRFWLDREKRMLKLILPLSISLNN